LYWGKRIAGNSKKLLSHNFTFSRKTSGNCAINTDKTRAAKNWNRNASCKSISLQFSNYCSIDTGLVRLSRLSYFDMSYHSIIHTFSTFFREPHASIGRQTRSRGGELFQRTNPRSKFSVNSMSTGNNSDHPFRNVTPAEAYGRNVHLNRVYH